MSSFLGMRLVANPLLVEKKTVRIRGGYLDRWLIRAEVMVPSTKIFQNPVDGTYHCHPDLLDKIREATKPQLPLVQNVATAMDNKARARRRGRK